MLDEEADPRLSVGNEPLQRRGARPERRRAGEDLLLERSLVVEKGLEDARPGALVLVRRSVGV